MWYVITGKDAPDALAIRKRVRPEHLERARRLAEQGRMLVAGPALRSTRPIPALPALRAA